MGIVFEIKLCRAPFLSHSTRLTDFIEFLEFTKIYTYVPVTGALSFSNWKSMATEQKHAHVLPKSDKAVLVLVFYKAILNVPYLQKTHVYRNKKITLLL